MGFFSKKDKSPAARQEEDPNASALFSGRKAAASSAATNPYASPAPNPYGAPPPSKGNQQGGYTPSAQPYSSSSTPSSDLFGNRQPNPSAPTYGSPAYGQQPTPHSPPPPSYRTNADDTASGYSTGTRTLTAEQEEEEEVDAVKQEIRFTKQESVSSTRNALRAAAQAEETGRNTLLKLSEQGERLHNTSRNLDIARSHNITAEDKSRELKKVNGSMIGFHVKNPMKSKSRAEAAEAEIRERSAREREERERGRLEGYQSRAAVGQAMKGGYGSGGGGGRGKASVQERSRYQFEGGDEEDDQMEDEIDRNLDLLGGAAGRLNALAKATGRETDRQIGTIAGITQQSDFVDDQMAVTTARINRIR